MRETILLTGFGPFASHERNPSGEAVERLEGEEAEGFLFRSLVLPVQFERAVAALEEAIETYRPSAVIATGIHGEPTGLRLELAARNERNYPVPDVDGHIVQGEPVEEGGPPSAFGSLPVGTIKKALDEAGLGVELSEDAGAYLCNAVFYWLARRVSPAGFLHLPCAPERLEELVRAVRLTAEETARRLAAQRVEATTA